MARPGLSTIRKPSPEITPTVGWWTYGIETFDSAESDAPRT